MSPYLRLRDHLGLTVESGTSQSFDHAYLLLTALGDLDTDNPAPITYANDDAMEVLHRLRTRGYRGFAMQAMEKLLVPRVGR